MAKTGEIDVAHVARLARLDLTEAEAELFQEQLGRVLEYAEKLKQPDTSDIATATEAGPLPNSVREDETRDWLTAEEALGNAPRQANDLFIVPKVVE
ncbi:MAG TPA: Asp-tRNA(Asn)/Glu-tRNA(Gln) amidotransferase subunit GatC [Chthoniobacterales bacterium]|jgi:aspartyl-tRNA(Asn)/glutamyl-tRNA(Gln) amidotransferase subunit C|nr:Asp-tRNA(Asn)/Glu-tRNA(Gln) amidotransferase subunit GatC [Chthoniobacterales bacterium]